MITKFCKKCETTKPILEFHKNKSTIDGLHSQCKKCKNEYDRKHRSKKEYKEKERKRGNYRNHHDWNVKLRTAKNNAAKRGLEFSISIEDVPIPEFCPLTGLKLTMGKYRWTKPSIDRIDSTKGYIPGNVWVISVLANTMKSIATKEQLLTFSRNVLKIFDN